MNETAAPETKPWGLVILLGALSMMGPFSIDTYLPSFPDIQKSIQVERIEVQKTLTVYLITFAAMSLFYGTLSDSFGRKKVILFPLGIYAAASVGAACARDITWLLIFRGMQGLSSGAGTVVGRAMVRDRFKGGEGQRVLAYVTMVFALAPAIAPMIGGWLQHFWGWRSVFFFLGLMSIILLLTSSYALPETLPVEKRRPLHLVSILRHYLQVGSHLSFLLQAFAGGFGFCALALYISTAPDFIMTVLHLPETAFGWLFVPIIAGMTAGSAIAGKLAHSIKPEKLIWIALGIQGFAAALNLLYTHFFVPAVPWAIVPAAIYMFGLSMGSPGMTLKTLDIFPAVRGLAASLQGFIGVVLFAGVAGLVAPFVFKNASISGAMVAAKSLAAGMAVSFLLSTFCWFLGTRGRNQPAHIPAETEGLEESERTV